MQKNITIFLLIGIIAFLFLNKISSCSKEKDKLAEKDNLISALQDSVKTIRHKDSSTTATIEIIKTNSVKDFLKLQTKDKEVDHLQDIVQDYKKKLVEGSSVTTGLIETVAELKNIKPNTIVKRDTVRGKDSIVYIYPTYFDSLELKKDSTVWVKVTGLMGRDTTNYKVKIYNEFSAIVGKYKGKPFVDINLTNPYSAITKLRSYQVSMSPPKRWAISIGAGYGANGNFRKLGDWQSNSFIGIFIGKPIIRF